MKRVILGFLLFLLLSSGSVSAHETKPHDAKVLFESKTPQFSKGNVVTVNVAVSSNEPVNATDLRITYPAAKLTLSEVDTENSAFTITVDETTSTPGQITLIRGVTKGVTGKNTVATLTFRASGNGSVNELSYGKNSLVMSVENENILSDSEVATVNPSETTIPSAQTEDLSVWEKIKQWNISFWQNTGGRILDAIFSFFENIF